MSAKRVKKEPHSTVEAKPPKPINILRQTLARNLLVARSDAKLTQQELADRAEVSQRMIWEIEQKQRNVTLETVGHLAYALGIRDPLLLLTPIRRDVISP